MMESRSTYPLLELDPKSGASGTVPESVAFMAGPDGSDAGDDGEPASMSGVESAHRPIDEPNGRGHGGPAGTSVEPEPIDPQPETGIPLRLVIVDDSHIFLGTLRRILETLPGIDVIGMANSGREAIKLDDRMRPDVVLMDLTMPEMDGLEASRLLATRPSRPMIVIMSIHDLPGYRKASLVSGADAFVTKSDLINQFQPLMRELSIRPRPEGPRQL